MMATPERIVFPIAKPAFEVTTSFIFGWFSIGTLVWWHKCVGAHIWRRAVWSLVLVGWVVGWVVGWIVGWVERRVVVCQVGVRADWITGNVSDAGGVMELSEVGEYKYHEESRDGCAGG